MRRGVWLAHIKRVRKPSGHVMLYYKHRDGGLTRLPDAPENSAEFLDAYAKAAAADGVATPRKRQDDRSLGRLAALYFASSTFKGLSPATQETWRRMIRRILSVTAPSGISAEDVPVFEFRPKHIEKDLAEFSPTVARNRLKVWRSLFRHAKALGWVANDPALDVKPPRTKSEPHRAWTKEDVDAFRTRWPLGTQQRLALELLYDHAPRRGDLVKMGRQHINTAGQISWKQSKTGHWTVPRALGPNAALAIKAFLAARPGVMTFMETRQGKAKSAKAFGEWFRSACHEAGLYGLSAHGLRHTLGSDAAEAGVSSMGIGPGLLGHSTESQARTYTQAADRKRIAKQASKRLEQERNSGIHPETGRESEA